MRLTRNMALAAGIKFSTLKISDASIEKLSKKFGVIYGAMDNRQELSALGYEFVGSGRFCPAKNLKNYGDAYFKQQIKESSTFLQRLKILSNKLKN